MVELPPNLPLVKADPVLLEQVLFNLIDNAAKYAPAGTRISIAGGADAGHVFLTVTDEGAGIPEAKLEAIFDKFTRLQEGDRGGRRYRAGAADLPRLHAGDGRHDLGGEPDRPAGRGLHADPAASRRKDPR